MTTACLPYADRCFRSRLQQALQSRRACSPSRHGRRSKRICDGAITSWRHIPKKEGTATPHTSGFGWGWGMGSSFFSRGVFSSKLDALVRHWRSFTPHKNGYALHVPPRIDHCRQRASVTSAIDAVPHVPVTIVFALVPTSLRCVIGMCNRTSAKMR